MRKLYLLLGFSCVLWADKPIEVFKAGPDNPEAKEEKSVETSFTWTYQPKNPCPPKGLCIHTFVEGQRDYYPKNTDPLFRDYGYESSFRGSYATTEAVQRFNTDLLWFPFALGGTPQKKKSPS